MSAKEDRDPPRLTDESHGPSATLLRAGRAYRPPLGLKKARPPAEPPANVEGAAPTTAAAPAESEARPRDPERSSKPPSSSSGGQ